MIFEYRSRRGFVLVLIIWILLFTELAGQPIGNLRLVNTPLDEQNPILSPDGKTMYFTRASDPRNVGGTADRGDIWFSRLTERGWSEAEHGGTLINNSLHNSIAGLSEDGKVLYLMGHYTVDGHPIRSQGLSMSHWTGSGWSAPVNILIPYFRNTTNYQSGTISVSGDVLIFSAETYGTRGAEDLYLSKKSDDGRWTEPVNLGNVINTSLQEVSPALSDDGKILWFASNGRGGKGSFDLYRADRLDETYERWSNPEPMGEFNTEGRELFFHRTLYGDFYTTTYNSDEYSDIVFSSRTDSTMRPVRNDSVKSIEVVVYQQSEKKDIFHLFGKVVSAKSEMPLEAEITLLAGSESTVIRSEDGAYSYSLDKLGEYRIKVASSGYVGVLEKLELGSQVVRELEMNFRLQPVEVGTTVNLRNVLFQQSTANLLPSSNEALDVVVELMKSNPKVEIELSGHTDNRGYHQLNMKLSRERVEAVKKYLVSQGIEPDRMKGRGYGGTRPIADNEDESSRQLNRRVEFTIVKD